MLQTGYCGIGGKTSLPVLSDQAVHATDECGWRCWALFVVCVQSYKKDSPSSGLFRVKVCNEHGMIQRNGTGMFP
jgi:hypothetical protein